MMIRNEYGTCVRALREQEGMALNTLARKLQVAPSLLKQVENGEAAFTRQELITCANVFQVSAAKLQKGEIWTFDGMSALEENMQETLNQLLKMEAQMVTMLEKMREMSTEEPFHVRGKSEKNGLYFVLYDEKTHENVLDANGRERTFLSAEDALKAVALMNTVQDLGVQKNEDFIYSVSEDAYGLHIYQRGDIGFEGDDAEVAVKVPDGEIIYVVDVGDQEKEIEDVIRRFEEYKAQYMEANKVPTMGENVQTSSPRM